MTANVRVVVTRDSVAAGDDCDAPHERSLDMIPATPIIDVIAGAAAGYLASIRGGNATWLACLDDEPVAVVAQQWPAPRLLSEAKGRVLSLRTPQRLFFAYHTQDDPDLVFDRYDRR